MFYKCRWSSWIAGYFCNENKYNIWPKFLSTRGGILTNWTHIFCRSGTLLKFAKGQRFRDLMPLFLIYFYHTVFSHISQLSKPSNLLLSRGMSLFHDIGFHRLNMELDLQILFGLYVYSCTHWLRPCNSPFPPRIWAHIRGHYWSAKADDISLEPPVGLHQSCESRRQKNSTWSRPRFREIWKVSSLSRSLSRSLPLSGKKVSPRPPHAENEPSIAVRGSRPHPLTAVATFTTTTIL